MPVLALLHIADYELLTILLSSDCKNLCSPCNRCHGEQYDPERIIHRVSRLRCLDGCICRIHTAACIIAAIVIAVVIIVIAVIVAAIIVGRILCNREARACGTIRPDKLKGMAAFR